MGRPRDKFSWEQVARSQDGWKCKHCGGNYKGSASRIRNHLSGQGNDISACRDAPREIRDEALKRSTMKKRRNSSVGKDNVATDSSSLGIAPTLQISLAPLQDSSSSRFNDASARNEFNASTFLTDSFPSSSIDQLITKRVTEEYVTDPLVKFLLCTHSDFIKDPNFRKFLERAHQYGVPSSLLRDYSLIIERSSLNIKEEVYEYMFKVKESWKSTGCTLMMFNLNEMKTKFSTPQKDKHVLGFYSPKGFIFVEAPDPSVDICEALKRHSPNMDTGEVTHFIHHHSTRTDWLGYQYHHSCELSDRESSHFWYSNIAYGGSTSHIELMTCLRNEIQGKCIDICKRSEWAQNLIKKAKEIHQRIIDSNLSFWYYSTLIEKGFKEFADGNHAASPLSRFLSITQLEDALKERLLGHSFLGAFSQSDEIEIQAILEDNKFWDDGRELKRALTLILKIPDLMDTLAPTAGYSLLAIDEAKRTIFRDIPMQLQEDTFWHELASYLTDNIIVRGATAYLNPVYFVKDVQESLKLQERVKFMLRDLVREEDREEIVEQLQRYSNQCSNLRFADIVELKSYHPVKWWEEHGHSLPLLRKYAIRVLSQPVSCLSNQVKKHMFQLEGEDDYILRLNVRMMEEFRSLRDDIYKPIDFGGLNR